MESVGEGSGARSGTNDGGREMVDEGEIGTFGVGRAILFGEDDGGVDEEVFEGGVLEEERRMSKGKSRQFSEARIRKGEEGTNLRHLHHRKNSNVRHVVLSEDDRGDW